MTDIRKSERCHAARAATSQAPAAPRVAVASGLGGIAGGLVSNAPRVLKTRAQLQLVAPKLGMKALTHGLPLHSVVSAVTNLWCFSVQHTVKSYLGVGQSGLASSLACGLGAGMSESWLTTPARRVLVRHATETSGQNLRQAARAVWNEDGATGLWKGAPMGAVRNGIGWGSYFTTLHLLNSTKQKRGALRTAIDSSLACAMSCMVAMPFDTVVTRMQSQSVGRSALATAMHIAGQEGVIGLYAGLGARLAQAVPASAVSFVVMTELNRKLAEQAPR